MRRGRKTWEEDNFPPEDPSDPRVASRRALIYVATTITFYGPGCNAGGIKSAGCGRNTAVVPYFAADEKPQRQSRERYLLPMLVPRVLRNTPL